MFQNPSSAPSSNPPSDSSSPSMRNVNLPSQPSSSHQSQSSHPPPSQLGAHSYTPFVPSNSMRPPQNNGPNGGPPRSPQYTRQMANGIGPRSQGGQNGGPSAGLSSPRLGPPHNGQPSPMPPPQMQPQMHQHMGMPWGNYYVSKFHTCHISDSHSISSRVIIPNSNIICTLLNGILICLCNLPMANIPLKLPDPISLHILVCLCHHETHHLLSRVLAHQHYRMPCPLLSTLRTRLPPFHTHPVPWVD